MEEWVGRQWHRFITHLADAGPVGAAVRLDDMRRSIAMMFRAGGGAPTLRVVPASPRVVGGPRRWAQRLAGSGDRATLAGLRPDALALPPALAVFGEAALNRDLYLWLAALAAHWPAAAAAHPDWIDANRHAAAGALLAFPGLLERYQRLVRAQLDMRPDPARLRPPAAEAERAIQAALAAQPDTKAVPRTWGILPEQVAPVWLWMDGPSGPGAAPVARDAVDAAPAGEPRPASAPRDDARHQAEAVDPTVRPAPLVLMFRAESLLSWSEFVRVNRADDDSDDGQALAAAKDLDTLAIAPDGQACASRVRFDLDLPSAAADDHPLGQGERQPEWDWKRRELRPDHCDVQRVVARDPAPFVPSAELRRAARGMRRRLDVWRAAPRRVRGQPDGDEIDLDAWVRHETEAAGSCRIDSPAVYLRRDRIERSLATLLLADLSLSTDAHASNTARVIDVIRDALYVFGEALTASGDPFAMAGFSSVRRHNVRIQHLKGFDEGWTPAVQSRIGAVKPGYYTRMGAAIRHASAQLVRRPEHQRLLLILTDGKPNDLDAYEGRYGLEDTRHAVQAARQAGLTPFCVTIDADAHDYLPLLFGRQGYALVHRAQDLARRLPAIYAALTRH